jgi:hypothetical protein
MSKKDFVVLASRVIALYFIFRGLDNLSYVPVDAFELRHYSPLPQEYLYKVHLMQLSYHLLVGTLFFIGAVWVYKCGPSIESFLSSPE